MNDTTGTLGHAIFTGLEKNEYLNELYDALLHNDFLRLFRIDNIAQKEVDTENALRFADLALKVCQHGAVRAASFSGTRDCYFVECAES